MDALLQGIQDPQRLRLEADLAARVAALFGRCPALCGFSVQESDLALSTLTCYPLLDRERADAVLSEVAEMLFELVDEEPEAAELLRGRTFARTLH